MGVSKITRLDRSRLLEVFRRAVVEEKSARSSGPRPRTVAVRAHKLYCESLPPDTTPPALVTFTQRVTGRSADTAILNVLKEGGIENQPHAVLDRVRLIASFRECLEKFQSRIERGVARPMHVADSAHKIYLEKTSPEENKPSQLTFRRLVYGQNADPEIVPLLEPHFPRKK